MTREYCLKLARNKKKFTKYNGLITVNYSENEWKMFRFQVFATQIQSELKRFVGKQADDLNISGALIIIYQ